MLLRHLLSKKCTLSTQSLRHIVLHEKEPLIRKKKDFKKPEKELKFVVAKHCCTMSIYYISNTFILLPPRAQVNFEEKKLFWKCWVYLGQILLFSHSAWPHSFAYSFSNICFLKVF